MPTDVPIDATNDSLNNPDNQPTGDLGPESNPSDESDGTVPGSGERDGSTDGGGHQPPPVGTSSSVLPLPSWWSFVLIGALMLLILLIVSQSAKYYFQWRADVLMQEFKLAPPAPSPTPTANAETARAIPTFCKAVPDADKDIQALILRQRAQAVEFGDGHRWAAIEFGSYFFANVAILGVFGLMSLISVAVIAKTGLDKANGHVIAIFLLATGTGLMYQSFFGVFQQKQNVDANISQSIRYAQLVSKIDTYCATRRVAISEPKTYLEFLAKAVAGPSPEGSPSPAPKELVKPDPFYVDVDPMTFAVFVEWHLEDFRRFAVTFDDKLVPSLTDTNRLSLNKF